MVERQLQNLFSLIRETQQRISRVIQASAFKDISFNQCHMVRFLVDQKSCCMTDLAREFSLSTAAVTKIVDRLEEAGLARRVQSKEDRRKIMLEATPRGRREVAHLDEFLGRLMERATQNFSEAQIETVLEFYRSIGACMDEELREKGDERNE